MSFEQSSCVGEGSLQIYQVGSFICIFSGIGQLLKTYLVGLIYVKVIILCFLRTTLNGLMLIWLFWTLFFRSMIFS